MVAGISSLSDVVAAAGCRPLLAIERTPSLADDNGLAWRITQHAGAGPADGVSSHMLVSVHVFLEMLHYGVWLVALPLIGARGPMWDVKTIPLFASSARFSQTYRCRSDCRFIAGALVVVWLFGELFAHARYLLRSGDCARVG